MRILITGGAGMTGSHCAEYFALKNDDVVVLDNLMRSVLFDYNKASVEYNWKYLSQYKNIKQIVGDVRNSEHVSGAIGDGVDAVIHCAGQPGVPSSVRKPISDFDINAWGTLNILECLRKHCKDATFIYCSTNKVYGENADKIPLFEMETRYIYDKLTCYYRYNKFNSIDGITETLSTDLTGHTPYGVSKLTGDLYTQEYAHIYGMKTGVFRMSCTTGIRQFGFEDQGWVSWFIIANLLNKPITIYGNGKQVRDLLYVTDLVKAFDRFIESGLKHEVFNIGGGPDNTVSLLEFIEKIERLTGNKMKLEFKDWRPSDQKVYISDISKIKNMLYWNPQVSVDESISKIVGWVDKNRKYF